MLLTLDDLRKKYEFAFPSTSEAVYESLLATAEELCLSYAEIIQGDVTEYFRNGSTYLALTYSPILSITSVTASSGTVPYLFNKRAGEIILQDNPASEVIVNYKCGWEEGKVPETIKQAIAFTVQHLAKLQSAKLLGINSRATDGGTETIEQSTPPLAVQKMLERFRRVKVL